MKLNFKGRAKQAGFTLIELIVVIVILGIMAATALPKFMDLGADARLAKAQAALAAVKSTMAMANGTALAQNKLDASVNGNTLIGGHPANANIMAMAGLDSDYFSVTTPAPVAGTIVIATDEDHPDCSITYTEATVDAGPPVTVTTAATVSAAPSLADCQ